MDRKRYSDEDALNKLREIDMHLHDGLDVVSSCRKAIDSDKTQYYWLKKFGGWDDLSVTSRKVVWLFLEQLRLDFVPALHRLQGRPAAQG